MRQRKASTKRDLDSGFPLIRPNAAGIDIGSREHFVTVPEERSTPSVRSFGCTTSELREMAAWLKSCGVDTVAMEATGVYWVPVYEVLEDAGIEAFLFDGRQARHVSGRKSDVLDCQWSQKLHSYGLLTRAFRPDKEIATLRAYWRHREGIVESCSRQIHLMHKALEQMNVQLHKAVSDVTGQTGMRILRAIVAGERDRTPWPACGIGGSRRARTRSPGPSKEPTARNTCLPSSRPSKPTTSSSSSSPPAIKRSSDTSARLASASQHPLRRPLRPSDARTSPTSTCAKSSPASPESTSARSRASTPSPPRPSSPSAAPT